MPSVCSAVELGTGTHEEEERTDKLAADRKQAVGVSVERQDQAQTRRRYASSLHGVNVGSKITEQGSTVVAHGGVCDLMLWIVERLHVAVDLGAVAGFIQMYLGPRTPVTYL
jgi:hypothetical protein